MLKNQESKQKNYLKKLTITFSESKTYHLVYRLMKERK